MKKFTSIFTLLAISAFAPLQSSAELLSEESVKDINNTWNSITHSAKDVKDSVKQKTQEGINVLGNAYDEISKDIVQGKNNLFANNDDDDDDDNDDRDNNDDDDNDDHDDDHDDNDDDDDHDDDDDDRDDDDDDN